MFLLSLTNYQFISDLKLGAAEDEKGIGQKAFDKFFENLDKDGT